MSLKGKKIICEVPNYTFDMFVCPSVCDIDINYHISSIDYNFFKFHGHIYPNYNFF